MLGIQSSCFRHHLWRPRFSLSTAVLAFAALGQEPVPVFTQPSEYTPPPGSTYPAAEWEKVENTTGMMVILGGRVLFEYGNVIETSRIASVRKSVLGMLFGKYIASDSSATLQHLLMARSGIYWRDADRDSPRKGSVAPGTQFAYNNSDFGRYVLKEAMRSSTEMEPPATGNRTATHTPGTCA